jgi:RNA polymerase sigma factor (sigma-70 family)
MPNDESIELLRRIQSQDSAAAYELFHRYVDRLLALVRVRLCTKLVRRIDPEDVVQSAYRSFFSGAEDGRFELQNSGDLWRLLAAITLNKLHRQVDHHQAGRRTIAAEQSVLSTDSCLQSVSFDALANEPSPEQAAILIDEVQFLMTDLNDDQREMLEMRLQGFALSEIAERKDCSERTVRRMLEKVKSRLEQRLSQLAS